MRKKQLILLKKHVFVWFLCGFIALLPGCNYHYNQIKTQRRSKQADYFIKNDQWIYFANPLDGDYLYKFSFDLSEKHKVQNISIVGKFMIDQNWIYYVKQNKNKNCTIVKTYLYDSANTVELKTAEARIINNLHLIALLDDYIYFEGVTDQGNLPFRIKVDGSKLEKINNKNSSWINVGSEWILYQNRDDQGAIFKMNHSGTQQKKINHTASENLMIIWDWVYFSKVSDKGKLYKLNSNNGDEMKLGNEERVCPLLLKDKWIYYTQDNLLYRSNENQTHIVQIVSQKVESITMIDDYFYCKSLFNNGRFRVQADGTNQTPILILPSKDSIKFL